MRLLFDKDGGEGNGKNKPELVLDEAAIRSAVEKETRAAIAADTEKVNVRVKARNTEIRALADEFIKDHGTKWAGKPGAVVIVGERIRSFEFDACTSGADRPDAEVRSDFKAKCRELIQDARAPQNTREAANLPDQLASRCSLSHILRSAGAALAAGDCVPAWVPKDGAEFEAHTEFRNRALNLPGGDKLIANGGLHLPANIGCAGVRSKDGSRQTRDALAGDFATAGAFVQPQFILPFIELLRNTIVCSRLGAMFLGGLMGNIVLPRQEAATTAQSVAEGAATVAYDQVLGQIKMFPHRVGSKQDYSRLALIQSTPDFEGMVWNDHAMVIALYMDLMALTGSGAADQPLGLMNTPGVNTILFAGTPTYSQIVSMRTAIRKFNVPGPLGWATTSTGQGRLAVLPETLVGSTVVSGSTNAIWKGDEDNGTILGSKAIASQQVPGDRLIAGVWSNLIIGQWGGVNVVLDTYTRADRDEVRLTTNTYLDSALRHAQAFTVSGDSVNQ